MAKVQSNHQKDMDKQQASIDKLAEDTVRVKSRLDKMRDRKMVGGGLKRSQEKKRELN